MTQAGHGQLLTLAVDDRRLGVPSRQVREVARMPRLTPVPHAPPAMLGLANVRGTVMPVLSLGLLTGAARDGGASRDRRLVVLDAGEPVALAVDAVAELIDAGQAEAAQVEPLDALPLVASTAAPREKRSAAASAEESVEAAATNDVSLVTFAIGSQAFAFALDVVEEVLRLPAEIAVVPHAEPMAVGSIVVRGELLPLLGLAALLALPARAHSARSRVLVVRIGEQRVGLVVDAMRGVERVDEGAIDPVPLVLTRGDAEARIQAVCRLGNGKLVSVLAPAHLLREDLTAQLHRGGPARTVAATEATEDRSEPFLVVAIGDGRFGLPLAAVEQVTMLPASLGSLPRSPAFVRGVMPLRGEIVPVIDQARRFGAASAAGSRPRVVVVRVGAQRAGFLVDGASEIRRIPLAALQPAPHATLSFAQVATQSDDALVLILDPAELLDGAERDLLAAMAPGVPTS